jgi:hypothetical protein
MLVGCPQDDKGLMCAIFFKGGELPVQTRTQPQI